MPMFLLENVGIPSYLPWSDNILDHLGGTVGWFYENNARDEH